MKHLISLVAAIGLSASLLSAQDSVGIPADVFYLMPKMAQGTLLFRDKSPVAGQFNICALDNTVRFKDKGTELAMKEDESMLEVIIDGVPFLHRDGTFYRLYAVSDEAFVAVKRDVLIMNDSQMASYGMESNTTAVQTIETMNMPGRVLDLSQMKDIPYRMTETASLYRKGSILSLSKRNFIKCFPDKKADIEAWFAANKRINPQDIETVLALCQEWGTQ
jgi:hypothetical protein